MGVALRFKLRTRFPLLKFLLFCLRESLLRRAIRHLLVDDIEHTPISKKVKSSKTKADSLRSKDAFKVLKAKLCTDTDTDATQSRLEKFIKDACIASDLM